MDLTSLFKGITTPLPELQRQIEEQGWTLDKVVWSGDKFVAKAKSPNGDSLERTGNTDRTAVGNLLIAVLRRNNMNRVTRLAAWEDMSHWTDVKAVADAYAKAPIYDPKAVGAFKELADDSVRRMAILSQQLHIEVVDDPEPYSSPQEMCEDIHKKQHFYVSRANSEHPLWSTDQNVAFRVVHDVMGHCVAGGSFDFAGELKACSAHFPLLSTEAQKALATECIGQTAYAAYYRGFGPQKICFLDEFLDQAQADNNPAAHQGVHPSQSIPPSGSPAIPQPQYDAFGLEKGNVAPHQEGLGLTPVMTKKANEDALIDPNKGWQAPVETSPTHHAIQHYGDPLDAHAVKENAALIDTGWHKGDPNDPSARARMKQAIVNAFRVVLLSPRKDLRWNAVHYQDIASVPADVKDPKVYWDTLEEKRKQHNVARGRHPEAHLIYFKPRLRYYQMVHHLKPNLSLDEVHEYCDQKIFKLRQAETERIEAEDQAKPPEKQRTADEIERRVNEAIAKALKQLVDDAYNPATDKEDQASQTSLFAHTGAAGQTDLFTGEGAEFYGAWMGSHLKSISKISEHIEDLTDAALEDVKEHDGAGHHFRAAVLKLNISGVGPKVCSFAWLLLQPLTSQLATIDTHMMDVLGHDYEKEMNNRDYFKFERELQAGRDSAGYNHVPLGQFQWGMWDYKRTGPGTHQDHSAMRVLDPVAHSDIDWAAKAQNLKGEDWAKQAPTWWQATQEARDQVGQHWDETIAPSNKASAIPFQMMPKVAKESFHDALPGEYGKRPFKYWWDKEKPLYGDEAKLIADYAAATKMTKTKLRKFIDEHKSDVRGDFDKFKKRCLDRFDGAARFGKVADAAMAQSIPWHQDDDGNQIKGRPGHSLMRHLRDHHGLSTQEIWDLDPEVGKEHPPEATGAVLSPSESE